MLLLISLGIVIFLIIVVALFFYSEEKQELPKNSKHIHCEEFLNGYSIAGINRNKCQLKHVGAFMGKLVEDPDNEFDPNAIMVMHEDGSHLGFIKAAETAAVRNYLGNGFEEYPCVGFIKFVEQYDEEKDDGADEYENTGFFVGRIYIDSELEE